MTLALFARDDAHAWPSGTAGPLAVADAELTTLPDTFACPHPFIGTRFLLRLHGEPIARILVPALAGHVPLRQAVRRAVESRQMDSVLDALARRAVESGVTDVASLWRDGARVAAHIGSAAVSTTALTVAICTRDRPEGVARVLASLAHEGAAGTEVLVIDNAPRDGATRAIVAGVPWARYQVQPIAGLDHARNLALQCARGDVVAFADDDVLVDESWCRSVRMLFDKNPELTLLTGLVEPAALETEAEQWFELYGGFGRGYAPRWEYVPGATGHAIAFTHANTGRYGTGANLALRRLAALRLGGFDPALDVGTATRGGGDLEMMFRVLKAGGVVAYTNTAVVRHAHRRTWDELVTQIESWGSGMAAHLARTARAHPDERAQVAALKWWLYGTWFAKRLATSYVRAPFPRALIKRELHGSVRGEALYREAAQGYPPPGPTPTLHPALTTADDDVRAAAFDVYCGKHSGTIERLSSCRVALRVHVGDRMLGIMRLPTVGGVVGETRLRDAIAARWRRSLLGGDEPAARRTVAALIARGASQ